MSFPLKFEEPLTDHVREVVRDYLWNDIGPKWASLSANKMDDVAFLLTSRLARSMVDEGASKLAADLGADSAAASGSSWHPSRIYIVPALGGRAADYSTGDLLTDLSGGWWLLLQPACDLAQNKAEFVLLVQATKMDDAPAFLELSTASRAQTDGDAQDSPGPDGQYSEEVATARATRAKKADKKSQALRQMVAGSHPRYFHLPAFLGLPDLLVDFQQASTVPITDLQAKFEREASLNSPYTQALVSRFSSYLARIGLPDPPASEIVDNWRRRAAEAST